MDAEESAALRLGFCFVLGFGLEDSRQPLSPANSHSHHPHHPSLSCSLAPPSRLQPASLMSLDLVDVRYAMHAPVVTLREQMRLGDVRDVLRKTRHNGFPVVRDTPQVGEGGIGGSGLGLISMAPAGWVMRSKPRVVGGRGWVVACGGSWRGCDERLLWLAGWLSGCLAGWLAYGLS